MPTYNPNQYNPPGVYEEEIATATAAGTASNVPTLLGLVGPSVAYRTHSESVLLSAETEVSLAKLGIDLTSVVVTDAAGTAFVLDTDYELTAGAGDDEDAGATYDNPTTINRIAAGGMDDNSVVYVSYQYTDEDQFEPRTFTLIEDVVRFHGQAFAADGRTIVSPLTLAAEAAFRNGSPAIVCVATTPADEGDRPAGWTGPFTTTALLKSAGDKLINVPAVNVVVPISAGITTGLATVGTDLVTAVTSSTENGLRRIGVFGAENGSEEEGATVAGSVFDERATLVWPRSLNYFNSQRSLSVPVGGTYAAAGIGAMLASSRPQAPLTADRLRGFTGITSSELALMTRTYKDALSSGGVTVIEPDINGNLVVRHGVTTKIGEIFEREISMVRARDAMVTRLRTQFVRSGLIGGPLTTNTLVSLKGMAIGILDSLAQQGVIVGYTTPLVRSTGVDPSLVEVEFSYKPTYPLNFILFRFSIDPTTADVNVTVGDLAPAA